MTDDEIFKLLKADVQRASALGAVIDMTVVGVVAELGRLFQPAWSTVNNCPMCAIGAHLLGQTCTIPNYYTQFARDFGRSSAWGKGFYNGSIPENEEETGVTPEYRAGFRLGRRMIRWVNREKKPGGMLA